MKTTEKSDNFVVSFRLKGGDAVRFHALEHKAKTRNYKAQRVDIVRELIGLDPLHFVTAEEAEYFRTGKKVANGKGSSSGPD